jgi:hypothetical protein
MFYVELKKQKMRYKALWINIIVLLGGVYIGYLVFHKEAGGPAVVYMADKVYEGKYQEANKKYDSLKIEFEKKPKKIIINEKIRDTIYVLDSIGTDSLQRKLLRYYLNNKSRFDPNRFDFIKAAGDK